MLRRRKEREGEFLNFKTKVAFTVCFAVMLGAATILSAYIKPAKSGTTSKFLDPPYPWLIKVTNINTLNASIRGFFSEQDLYGHYQPMQPYIMPIEPRVIPPGQVPPQPPGIWEVTCEIFPEDGYTYIEVLTWAVPDDLHLNVTIWYNQTESYINTFTFARQYPDVAGSWGAPWPRHQAYTGLPHFPIPFHYEWDLHRGMMQPSSLVSLDIEPLYNFPVAESDWYNVTAGEQNTCGHWASIPAWHRPHWDQSIPTYGGGGVPFATRAPYLRPHFGNFIIDFSLVDNCNNSIKYPNGYWAQSPGYPGMVYLKVPNANWTGINHTYWSPRLHAWCRAENLLHEDGYGWIFTQPPFDDGVNPLPDVDIFLNNSYYEVMKYAHAPGVGFVHIGSHNTSWNYWVTPSPWPGRCAAYRGGFPDIGPDLIPGTDDDGYGDGILDPKGSSIMYLPTVWRVSFWDTGVEPYEWRLLYQASFPAVLTTESAKDLVGPPSGVPAGGSAIYECWAGDGHPEYLMSHTGTTAPHGRVLMGKPWQFLHDCEPWETEGVVNEDAKKTVIYVCQYSVLRVATRMYYLDISYDFIMCLVKHPDSSLIVGDGAGEYGLYLPPGVTAAFTDFKVGWQDLFNLAAAYGSSDENFATDKRSADTNYDGRYDTNSIFGPWDSKIGWQDLFALAGNYGNQLAAP